jgi:hypothetical protein
MDPPTLALTLGRAIATTGQIIASSEHYISKVKLWKESIKSVIRELTVLKYNLEGLNKFLRSGKAELDLVFERTSVLWSCMTGRPGLVYSSANLKSGRHALEFGSELRRISTSSPHHRNFYKSRPKQAQDG